MCSLPRQVLRLMYDGPEVCSGRLALPGGLPAKSCCWVVLINRCFAAFAFRPLPLHAHRVVANAS
jgi:hypothetical protein